MVLGFGDGHLHVAVEGHARDAWRCAAFRGFEIQLAKGDLAARGEADLEIFPVKKLAAASSGRLLAGRALPQALGRAAELLGLVENDRSARSRSSKVCSRRSSSAAANSQPGKRGADAGLLGQRQDLDFGDLHDGALGLDIESADGFDLVAEEFDAQGAGAFGAEDVQDAAADGIFADHFHGIAPLVADG